MEDLLEILRSLHPDVDFETEEYLIDKGILDSMDIVSLISEINDAFEVTITAKDIVPANFNSAQALYELIQEGRIEPKLVIGVPVGFVNVVQSKEMVLTLKHVPYIVAQGRKGGSNIAACICNALIYQL